MCRAAVDFAVTGDLRFLSHQEMLRLWTRACARTELPLRWSQGFNPHPRVSLPLPRAVGIASRAERLILELNEWIAPDDLHGRLGGQLPDPISLLTTRVLEQGDRSVPVRASYRVDLQPGESVDHRRCARLLESDTLEYERFVHKKNKSVRIDLRPYLENLTVGDDCVFFRVRVTPGGSARPSEVCDLVGIGDEHVNHRITRLEVEWAPSL